MLRADTCKFIGPGTRAGNQGCRPPVAVEPFYAACDCLRLPGRAIAPELLLCWARDSCPWPSLSLLTGCLLWT